MIVRVLITVLLLITFHACAQNNGENKEDRKDINDDKKQVTVGDGCEGCEAVFESPVPFESLSSTDTLPGFNSEEPKIEISGVVYNSDGKTPAPGVVIYLYHTDRNGYYSTSAEPQGWEKRHGKNRGWLKTNEKGEYSFLTFRLAPYPNAEFPAHIHPTIKEPGKTEYWIDDFVFDDDKLVNESYREKAENRGGDGIVTLQKNESGIYTARRDIILGKTIPNYKD